MAFDTNFLISVWIFMKIGRLISNVFMILLYKFHKDIFRTFLCTIFFSLWPCSKPESLIKYDRTLVQSTVHSKMNG